MSSYVCTVDEDLYRRVQIIAAKARTSIDELLNAELSYLADTYEAAESSSNLNYMTLLDFSLGRIDDLTAMEALRITSEEDLFLLMAQAHLPMPRLASAATQAMVAELDALLAGYHGKGAV